MPLYEGLLRGKGFSFRLDDRVVTGGWFTMRRASASSLEVAEAKMVDQIRRDSRLRRMLVPMPGEAPMVFLDEYRVVPWWRRFGGKRMGFVFFEGDGEDGDEDEDDGLDEDETDED